MNIMYAATCGYLNTKTDICIDTKAASHIATAMMETTTNVNGPASVLGQFSSLYCSNT